MIIHPAEFICQEGYAIAYSKIELDTHPKGFPEYVWYRVPIEYKQALSLQSDAFLVPALLGGMFYGENIQVRGPVSPRLAYNLDEYQFLLSMRFPEYLKCVDIQYDLIEPLVGQPGGIGTTFSGGVDSLFTLWKHLPKNQPNPDYQVTHVLFIKGFDLIHSEDQAFRMLYDVYSEALEKISIQIIPLETNSSSIRHLRLPDDMLYGPTICGAGLAMAGLLNRYFVPSSWDYHQLSKRALSTDPWTDRLVSTDTLNVIHHGTNYRRVEKIEEIADWDLAQEVLWVCQNHVFAEKKWNCSRCEKCVRTMISLYALGKLDQFTTFAKPMKTNKDGLWWVRKFSFFHDYASETLPFVKRHKPDFLPWLRVAVFFGKIRYWLMTHLPRPLKKWMRRFGYFIPRNEALDAYEIPEITQLLKGLNDHPPT